MSARKTILSQITASLKENSGTLTSQADRMTAAERRVNSHPRGVIPDLTTKSGSSTLSVFCEKAVAAQATIKKVKSYAKAGSAVQSFLRQHNLPQQIRTGSDPKNSKLVWDKNLAPQILVGPSDGNDLVCLSHALGAVAETGTLYLISGPSNPTTLNFLPENHVVIVAEKDIRKSYEGMWKTLRRKYGKGKLPRTVNMITGPSRSADIEQTLILGAHGPLKLHVIVVEE
ncbi:MAG: lactate utilization protein [Rhizobiaceae bacterium]|nr:lactate utilization protein [Rhizobiaceae bacterium]